MIKRILLYSNEEDRKILESKSEPVTDINSVKDLIQDLRDTLHGQSDGSHGISASQIGELKNVCICSWDNREIVMINPEITKTRGLTVYTEGCLSVPGIFKKIPRAQKVWCTYLNEQGETCEIAEGGRMSDIIQHELDHMQGICKVHE